ncbi:MAG: dehydrogenase [Oscillospiraceae bacterium]|jgi:2-oxoisovalerate dehydrogenase E1 component|nr:dehydrogenase [Oscillospiraceae bacterium]
MPNSRFVDPTQARAPGELTFESIPLNAYQTPFAESAKGFSKADLLGIFHDMRLIREFENMLYSVRTQGSYNGIKHVYDGPAYLYSGQEAAAVGMAYTLDGDDIIFGSHRSHGEVLAKGCAAIKCLDKTRLLEIMRRFGGGAILEGVEKANKSGDIRDIAIDFLLYGFMSELFGRSTGFARGLGNSMHVFFTPFGIYPNNAIVGGSAGIAAGAALFKRVNGKPGMVVCNIGDASLGCGPVWEALNFAAQEQFTALWDEEHGGGLPVIFNFLNNHYGMGGRTAGETMAYGVLARAGAGISPTQLHAERIDGYNVFAVIDAFARKRKVVAERRGPVLLDTVTYRFAGHYEEHLPAGRERDEVAAWQSMDSIKAFGDGLTANELAAREELLEIENEIRERVTRIMRIAADEDKSPRIDLFAEPDGVRRYMFSNLRIDRMDEREPDVTASAGENARLASIAGKSRFAFDQKGNPVPEHMRLSVSDALFEAVLDKFYEDPTLIAFGEDNRDGGGAGGVYGGMAESIPYHRFFSTPMSEGAIVSAAVGYALCGGRALPALTHCDLLGRAGDEVFNQLSKWQAMSAGVLTMPVVLRMPVGSKYGAQHSQDWSSLAAHIPGLKVVFPATPYDAKGLMNAALNGTDPVVFFESRKLYGMGEMFRAGGVPEDYYEVAIGEPDVKRAGCDVTVLSIGAALYAAAEAADILKDKYGLSAELIDARSLVPFNYEKVIESVKKTGRIVLVSEACERGAYAGDIARNITELCFSFLDAPPAVVAAPNAICPCPELEDYYYPRASWIIDAIHEKLLPLPDYTAAMNYTGVEKLRREALGI